MDTLQDLQRKIRSAEDLHGVVRTMKSLAAVSIHQYQEAAASLEDYYRTVELGLRAVLLHHALLGAESEPREGVVFLFGSDQGMAGQFNELIADYARESAVRDPGPECELSYWVAGGKAAGLVEDRLGPVEEFFELPGSAKAISDTVQDALLRFEARRRERGETRLILFHNVPTAGASYRQERLDLLPPGRGWLEQVGAGQWPNRCLPLYTLPWPELFSSLIGEYLFVALFRAFATSLAAENAARLAAMERAEKNIQERREELTARYHSERQSAITEELFDVISGFEALGGGDS